MCFASYSLTGGSITEYGNVMAYISGADHPYISEDGHGWDSVEIVDCNEFVKKASEIVKWLEDNEYQVDRDGNWENGDSLAFGVRMFFYCGKKKCDDYTWLEEWIEELPILS